MFLLSAIEHEVEPTSYAQAAKDPRWRATMTDDYNALITNNTWELVPYSNNMNVVTCKWIYKVKYRSDGTEEWPKARLVARGIH